MPRTFSLPGLCLSLLMAASLAAAPLADPLTTQVDPFIGTANGGNTFPGAVRPWGLVSVSPHNDLATPSGYTGGKPFLYGFGHVHLSGVGCPDLGNVAFLPATGTALDREGFKSAYADEEARPGYYKVRLTPAGITAEMTAGVRAGFSRYTFPATDQARVLLDLGQVMKDPEDAEVAVVGRDRLEGFSRSGNFCESKNKQSVYFAAVFDRPFAEAGTWQGATPSAGAQARGKDIGAWLRFDARKNPVVRFKVGVSYVSLEGARANLASELKGWDFAAARRAADAAWERELSKIEVAGGDPSQRRIFYTGLYHMLLHPNVFSDVDGRYQGLENSGVKRAQGYTQYTVYSLWDTYRDEHPFLTLLYPARQRDMVRSILAMARDHGWLPKWELAGRETRVMVGDPAAIVLADTWLRGLRGFDGREALAAMLKSATQAPNPVRNGLKAYLQYGYIPKDDSGGDWVWGSLSTTLEYCLADDNIARLAEALGDSATAAEFRRRAGFYQAYFDPASGFLRPKMKDGSFLKPFNPDAQCCDQGWPNCGGPGYVEGSAWQYSFFVPHDVAGLTRAMGGDAKFLAKLDQVFGQGHFDMSNEPDMAYPYLYTYFPGQWGKAQAAVRTALAKDFNTTAGGIPGNDDCGVTSAWMVWSMLGLYPAAPGQPEYRLGLPAFDKAVLKLDNGARVTILRKLAADGTAQAARFNGKALATPAVTHADLVKGGTLIFE